MDTSVFIAAETGRPLTPAPDGDARVSVVTLAELSMGVRATAAGTIAAREQTLEEARLFIALPVDEHVADRFAALVVAAKRAGRRAEHLDAMIAATAIVHDLTVWTQDAGFDVLAEIEPALRVHRG